MCWSSPAGSLGQCWSLSGLMLLVLKCGPQATASACLELVRDADSHIFVNQDPDRLGPSSLSVQPTPLLILTHAAAWNPLAHCLLGGEIATLALWSVSITK